MPEIIVEIHVPLAEDASTHTGGDPYPWIDEIQDFLMGLEGPHGEYCYDDGEEWQGEDGPEYLFFLSNGSEDELLEIARAVARRADVPAGAYATVNDEDGDMGTGRRVDLTA